MSKYFDIYLSFFSKFKSDKSFASQYKKITVLGFKSSIYSFTVAYDNIGPAPGIPKFAVLIFFFLKTPDISNSLASPYPSANESPNKAISILFLYIMSGFLKPYLSFSIKA